MFKSTNFTPTEKISLSKEIALIGVQSTPFTSLLMSKGNIEKALSTVYTWRTKTLNDAEDLSATEGSDDIKFYSSARAELNNILEIFSKGVQISGTASAMQSTIMSQEVADRLLELKINMEKKFINGTRKDGSTSPFIRQMSGLLEMASPANDVAATAVTEDVVKEAMRNLWNADLAEGTVYAFLNADLKEQVDAIYKDRYGYAHVTTDFGLLVDSINTNYGKVHFVLSKHVPADKIIYFNDAYVDIVNLRPAHFEALAKDGDSTKGFIVAESTLKVGAKEAVGVTTITP